LIFAGGGYGARMAYEDAEYAEFLNGYGIDTFVVDYRITNRVAPDIFPDPLLDARRAVRFVRANGEKFGIDPDKIAVMGSSAGGHLSAIASTYREKLEGEGVDALDEIDYLPNAQILCYPVTNIASERGTYVNLLGKEADSIADQYDPILLADEKTPPAFIWHTAEDEMVNVLGTYSYAKRLKELDVPVEMHIFPFGRHGLALGRTEDDEHHVAAWTELLERWLKLFKYIDEETK
jgi:acetyl esterase/lipase